MAEAVAVPVPADADAVEADLRVVEDEAVGPGLRRQPAMIGTRRSAQTMEATEAMETVPSTWT